VSTPELDLLELRKRSGKAFQISRSCLIFRYLICNRIWGRFGFTTKRGTASDAISRAKGIPQNDKFDWVNKFKWLEKSGTAWFYA
jgi:hypothetical protein